MGIYVKKKKFNILNFFLIFLFLIIVLTTLYFFNIFSEKKIFDLSNIENTQFEEGPNQIIEPDLSSYLKKEDVNFDEYFTKKEFDQNIKNFIEENPDYILGVLREYQLEQNKLEQEKTNQKNISSIKNLNLAYHPMYLGDSNSAKVIYEFVDYNCGYCQKFHQELINVMKDNSLKLVIIQMPILGNFSEELTKLALASSLQGQFKVVHNYLYSTERKSKMEDILADLFLRGVDLDILKNDLDSQEVSDFLSIHRSYADEFKFTGTPATIIGNQIIPGFIDADKITEILEKEFS
jgi:protein-disulfide isomerase